MPRLKVKHAVGPSVAPTREEGIAANPLPRFLAKRGYELRPAGRNFVTNACPVSEHKKYHRCVTVDAEKNVWHCNDCDRGGTVIDWVMLEKNITAGDAMRELSGGPNGADAKTKRLIEATYDYHDEEGTLVHRTVRYLTKKGEKKKFAQCRPDGKGGWIWNLKGIEPVLFRLPEITKDIHAGKPIFLPEGEKDVLSMVEHGLSATCNPMGAGKWRDSYSQTLRGAGVTIIADKDQSGREHGQLVASKIHGIAKSVRVIELPDLNQKSVKDASDYFAAGGDVEQLVALADSAPEWTPSADSEYPEGVPLMTLAERDIYRENNLLGNRFLCRSGIMFYVGPSGVGISSVSAQKHISWSLGRPAFHIRPARPLHILCRPDLGSCVKSQ